MRLCPECYLQLYCRNLRSRIVTDAELTHAFVDDLRDHARALGIAPGQWSWFLLEAYRDYPGLIVDAAGREVEVDIEVFFGLLSIRYWFRDFLKPREPGVVTRLRREARERIVVMATILRAIDPVRARLWGKTIANDGTTPLPPLRRPHRGCPYADPDGIGIVARLRARLK